MASSAERLYNFLRDIIYDPPRAELDLAALEDEYVPLGKGLLFLHEMMKEQKGFAVALSRGDLTVDVPSKENVLAAPIKSLHASLRHLTWQTQQVALGDYKQRVDFMGEFSDAFNSMIEQLDSRQRALEEEIRQSNEKSRALEQSNTLFTHIAGSIQQCIIVISDSTGGTLFTNPTADALLASDPHLIDFFSDYDSESGDGEITILFGGDVRYYEFSVYPITWGDESAKTFVMSDVSEKKRKRMELEHHATRDELTGVKNRRGGMETLSKWVSEQRDFMLCFIDLDNLKYVNDRYGHAKGDTYIICAATKLREITDDEEVSRVGGDEFMLLLPGHDYDSTIKRLAELRAEFAEESGIPGDENKGGFSYGVALSNEGSDPSELLSIADERMYDFKRANKKVY